MVSQGRSWSGRERNCCFLNTGGSRFANISASSGLDFPDDGRAAAVVDWDQDGWLDLWVSNRNAPRLRFLRNDCRSGAEGSGANHFLALRLSGNGRSTNRDAIGARVEVAGGEIQGGRLLKTLRAGEGFLAQSSKWVHFGLGRASRIERVVVSWPGGRSEEFGGIQVDRRYDLVQGSGLAKEWRRPGPPPALRPVAVELPPEAGGARIPLVALFPLPRSEYEDWKGRKVALPAGQGKHLLLNLWASRCGPCLAELKELAERESRIRAAGIEVLALSVDGLGEDRSDPAAAAELLGKMSFPFPAGRATTGLVNLLQYLHDGLIALHRPLPVPSSFLLDPQGRLSVIYKGRLSIQDLLQDLTHSGGTRRERRRRAAQLPGSSIESEILERAALTEEMKSRFQLALDLERGGYAEEAMGQYQEVLASLPDFTEAHNNLGLLCARLGRLAEAVAHYGEALARKPGSPEVHYNLGLAYEKLGRLEEAREEYQRALALKPGYPGAHNALGLAFAKEGKMARAREEFESEVSLHPDSPDARNHLGLALLQAGQEEKAALHFQEALRLKPDHADAHNNLGVLLKREGRLEEAVLHYRQAILAQPGFAEAHNNLGSIYLNQGKAEQALLEFQRALEARPDFAEARKNLERTPAGKRK
jgi:Flp pilus assembly protein TadD/peroxiredoxin